MRFILASSSPRRREILSNAGYVYEVLSPSVDEHDALSVELDTPEAFVRANAKLKGEAVGALMSDAMVLSADTTVAFEGAVLNKPADMDEAKHMIRRLAGQTHEVFTGYQLLHELSDYCHSEVIASKVTFKPLTDSEIDAYFEIVNPLDKAGAYGIQEGRELIIAGLEGSFTNVMGLPQEAVVAAIEAFEAMTGFTFQKLTS